MGIAPLSNTNRSPKTDVWKYIRYVPLLAIAILSIFETFRLPVYTDEIQWKYVNSRQLIDGGMQYLFPTCPKGFYLPAPLIWLPYRFMESIFYGNLHLISHLRVLGIFQYIVNLILLFMIARRRAGLNLSNTFISLSILFVGLMPFESVLNRPEQEMQVMFLLLLLIITSKKKFPKYLQYVKITLVILGLFSISAIHPKGLFLDLILVVLALFFENGRAEKFSYVVSLALAIIFSHDVWTTRSNCQENKFLQTIFNNLTLNPSSLSTNFFHSFFGNIRNSYQYLDRLSLGNIQDSWLTQSKKNPLWLSHFSHFLVTGVVVLLLGVIALSLVRNFARRNSRKNQYIVLPLLTIFTLDGLEITKNFYDGYLLLCLLLIAYMFSLAKLPVPMQKWISRLFLIIIIPNYMIGLHIGMNINSQSALPKTEVLQSFKNCSQNGKISPEEKILVFDDQTAPILWNQKRSIFLPYVFGWWATGTDMDLVLKQTSVSEIVTTHKELHMNKQVSIFSANVECIKIVN